MNSTLLSFFNRSLGSWESHRTCFHVQKEEFTQAKTILNISKGEPDNSFIIKWNSLTFVNNAPQSSEGFIEYCLNDTSLSLKDNSLSRSRGYLTNNATSAKIALININQLITLTEYEEQEFQEDLKFLSDNLRRRTSVARDSTGVYLVATYLETRLIEEVKPD